MPKKDFLTPKARLQKLRWYCQMCQKQCQDENGFKCHITSEAHQRQLLLVAENPGRVIGEFSREFMADFLLLLRTSYGTRRVHANEVYQAYIKNKDHYHMNATKWETLTGFVMFLGREGICEVENTHMGCFIKYLDRSPVKMAAAKKNLDKDDERMQKAIKDRIARALHSKGDKEEEEPKYSEMHRDNEEEKIVLSFKGAIGGWGVASSSKDCKTTTGRSVDVARSADVAETPPTPARRVVSAGVQRKGIFSKSKLPPAKRKKGRRLR